MEHRRKKRETIGPAEITKRPWMFLGINIFDFKQQAFLVVQDHYSWYIEAAKLNTCATYSVILELTAIFARHGIPVTIKTSIDSVFKTEEFRKFSKEFGIHHQIPCSELSESNGQIEKATHIVRQILQKEEKLDLGLLAYRSTPLECGFSPAELLFGRKIRNTLPLLEEKLIPHWIKFKQLENKQFTLIERGKKVSNEEKWTKNSLKPKKKEGLETAAMKKSVEIQSKSKCSRSHSVRVSANNIRKDKEYLTKCKNSEFTNENKKNIISKLENEIRTGKKIHKEEDEPTRPCSSASQSKNINTENGYEDKNQNILQEKNIFEAKERRKI